VVIVKINVKTSAFDTVLFDGVAQCPKYHSGEPLRSGHDGFWVDDCSEAKKVSADKALEISSRLLAKRYIESVEIIKIKK
jgi:hypothetical protein